MCAQQGCPGQRVHWHHPSPAAALRQLERAVAASGARGSSRGRSGSPACRAAPGKAGALGGGASSSRAAGLPALARPPPPARPAPRAPPPGARPPSGQRRAGPPPREHRPRRAATPAAGFAKLLSDHQRAARQQGQQQQQLPPLLPAQAEEGQAGSGAAAAAEGGEAGGRLDRKLTVVLTDSCASWEDVADVLAAADSAGRLNGVHVAAALARLARLAAAARAAESARRRAPPPGGHTAARVAAVCEAPRTLQQAAQVAVAQQAAGAAAAGGWRSRWHAAAPAADGGAQQWAEDADEAGRQHLLDELAHAVQQHWAGMSPTTATSCCWSLAVLQQGVPQDLLPAVGELLLSVAGQLAADGSDSSGGGGELPRQVVVLLWSLARMGVGPEDLHAPPPPPPPPPQQQQQQQQHRGGSSQPCPVQAVLASLLPHLASLSSQGLAMLLWALGSWRLRPLPEGAPAALLAASGDAVMRRGDVTPQGLAVCLWAVARLCLQPDASWLAGWLAAMRQSCGAAGGHECCMSVWALASLGLAPPGEWLAALCWRAGRIAGELGASELPALLWGLGRLRYRPPAAAVAPLLARAAALASAGALSPQGLSLCVWSAGTLRLAPHTRWADALLCSAADYLPLFRPAEASALMVGLVRLQHIPGAAWVDAWWAGSTDGLLQAADGRQLALLLWCGVALGQAPPAPWLGAWQAASEAAMRAGGVSARGYGLVWAALRQLDAAAPSPDWLAAFWRASAADAVLSQVDPLTAESVLAGLAAAARRPQGLSPEGGGGGEAPPLPDWWAQRFLAAARGQLAAANLHNIGGMLDAAGELQLRLPREWLDAAMARTRLLLERKGALRGGGGGSEGGHARLALAARLQRRWLAMRLRQVLVGLRAQQMLSAAEPEAPLPLPSPPPRRGGQGEAAGAGRLDALARWPWLAEAVLSTWPDAASAHQALQALTPPRGGRGRAGGPQGAASQQPQPAAEHGWLWQLRSPAGVEPGEAASVGGVA